jgi:hypothetical protein
MEAGEVKCDTCGYTVPIPSRAGYTCHAHAPGGYCRGTLRDAGYFAARAAEPEAETPAETPPKTWRRRSKPPA